MGRVICVLVAIAAGLVLTVHTPSKAFASEAVASASSSQDHVGHVPSAMLRRTVYDAGRWSIGVDGTFSMTSSAVELLDDDQDRAVDSTRFLRLTPWATVGIIDRLDVGLIAGWISRRLARENADAATENALAFQALGRYHLPLTPRLAMYGQIAPGYYTGRSERTVATEEEIFEDERTRTRAFILGGGLGINYRLTEGLQLRFGLAFTGIWGREAVEIPQAEIDESLSTSTTNLGTTAGLRYTF